MSSAEPNLLHTLSRHKAHGMWYKVAQFYLLAQQGSVPLAHLNIEHQRTASRAAWAAIGCERVRAMPATIIQSRSRRMPNISHSAACFSLSSLVLWGKYIRFVVPNTSLEVKMKIFLPLKQKDREESTEIVYKRLDCRALSGSQWQSI